MIQVRRRASEVLIEGEYALSGQALGTGDAARLRGSASLQIEAMQKSELIGSGFRSSYSS